MELDRPDALVRDATLAESVISIIAEVTRYPRSILRLEADLEEELGIELLKRAEILAALSSRLSLTVSPDLRLSKVRTIADVIATIEQLRASAPAHGLPPAPHRARAAPADPDAAPRPHSAAAAPTRTAVAAETSVPTFAHSALADSVLATVAQVDALPAKHSHRRCGSRGGSGH